jgi:hypothetical protein
VASIPPLILVKLFKRGGCHIKKLFKTLFKSSFLTSTTTKIPVLWPICGRRAFPLKNEALRGRINHDLNLTQGILLALVRKTMRRSVRKLSRLLTHENAIKGLAWIISWLGDCHCIRFYKWIRIKFADSEEEDIINLPDFFLKNVHYT